MYDRMRQVKHITAKQLEDILDKFHNKQLLEKKKNYTWLIVGLVIVGLAAAGFAVYKLFFAPVDDYDDYDDDDYDEIDFDEEYDEDDLVDEDIQE